MAKFDSQSQFGQVTAGRESTRPRRPKGCPRMTTLLRRIAARKQVKIAQNSEMRVYLDLKLLILTKESNNKIKFKFRLNI